MDYRLDKLIARDPLPGDEIAFKRVARAFAEARKIKPAVKQTPPPRKARAAKSKP